jgi:preprotein translocase subunit SecA
VEDAIRMHPGKDGFENFKLRMVHLFGFSPHITVEAYTAQKGTELSGTVYRMVDQHYRERMASLAEAALPVFQQIRQNQGNQIQTVVTPFVSPKMGMQIPLDLDEALETGGANIRHGLERAATLSMIDQAWKEHLREMDELRQSVQNASLEQKDPLLVYKFEAVKLFRRFIVDVNEQIVTFLFRALIPVEEQGQPQVQRQPLPPAPPVRTVETRHEVESIMEALQEQHASGGPGSAMQAPVAHAPIRVQKLPNRNDLVTVRYSNGEVKSTKFKNVEDDLKRGLCQLVDMA